jgi:ABC-type branched-subunit amino acid transport system ATPase component
MADPVLKVSHVSVRFSGVQALDDVCFELPPDVIFAIIGPNGAGKTTLFNCISGLVRPDPQGSIQYRGRELTRLPIHRAAQLGIARTFQNISLMREQSVRDNILAGLHLAIAYGPLAAFWAGPGVRRAEGEARVRVAEIVDILQLPSKILDARADTLSLGQQKKVEIARAVVRRPQLLLLDEPAGGLNDRETRDFALTLKALKADLGLSIVLIDHDMNLVMGLCDRIYVLNLGQKVTEGSPAEVQCNPDVISIYLGQPNAA